MRADIIDAFRSFSDLDLQRSVWVERRGMDDRGFFEDLESNFDILYNDSNVATDPYGSVGTTLRDDREARAVENFNRVFLQFRNQLSSDDDTDAAVIEKPDWLNVVSAARHALDVLTSSSED